MYRDYRNNVQFYYVYKSVQHPEINNYLSAFTLEERLKHVAEAKRRFGSEIPWICDNMKNDVKHAFGSAPNGEFVLDPEGKIVRKHFWSDPARLRKDLADLVGASEKVTQVADLPPMFKPEPRKIASGVVKPIALPRGLAPAVLEPVVSKNDPFFAKLRAEMTREVLTNGSGKLYLGMNLDPLYQVHWNNRAGRVAISIEAPDGVTVTPATLQSDEITADADVDPRQFLVDIKGAKAKQKLNVAVTYTVCDDAETFCRTIKQSYVVNLERNKDGGSRPGIFMPQMFANVLDHDKNKDGDVTKDELPAGQKTLFIGHMDYNGNETIEKAEIEKFMAMFNNGRGFDSAKNDGQK